MIVKRSVVPTVLLLSLSVCFTSAYINYIPGTLDKFFLGPKKLHHGPKSEVSKDYVRGSSPYSSNSILAETNALEEETDSPISKKEESAPRHVFNLDKEYNEQDKEYDLLISELVGEEGNPKKKHRHHKRHWGNNKRVKRAKKDSSSSSSSSSSSESDSSSSSSSSSESKESKKSKSKHRGRREVELKAESDPEHGTDTGMESDHEHGTDTGMESDHEHGTDTGMESDHEHGTDTGMESDLEHGTDTGMESDHEHETDTGMVSDLEHGTDTGMESDYGVDAGSSNAEIPLAVETNQNKHQHHHHKKHNKGHGVTVVVVPVIYQQGGNTDNQNSHPSQSADTVTPPSTETFDISRFTGNDAEQDVTGVDNDIMDSPFSIFNF